MNELKLFKILYFINNTMTESIVYANSLEEATKMIIDLFGIEYEDIINYEEIKSEQIVLTYHKLLK